MLLATGLGTALWGLKGVLTSSPPTRLFLSPHCLQQLREADRPQGELQETPQGSVGPAPWGTARIHASGNFLPQPASARDLGPARPTGTYRSDPSSSCKQEQRERERAVSGRSDTVR